MRIKIPPPAKFFFAVLANQKDYHHAAEAEIEQKWGAIDSRSNLYSLSDYTNYYQKEMGPTLWKYFLTLEDPIPMDSLVDVKRFAEDVQRKFSAQDQRTVNLDPGFITAWNLVLSTVKNYSHRIYLREGIYAEVTLIYKEHSFHPLPWTYPDYASPLALDFFEKARAASIRQLKTEPPLRLRL